MGTAARSAGTATLVATGLVAGGWLMSRFRALPPVGPPEPRGPAPDPPVSIVVPCRDEATTLPDLLGSVERLAEQPHEVLVVDDGSVDGTAALAAAHGATVIAGPRPPAGWLGKPWACHLGAAAATGELLLFLDADTVLAPDALARLRAEHRRVGGLLSVQPHHRPVRPYEQLSAICNVVAMMATGRFAPGAGAASPLAFGPCLLTSVADYRRSGGHASVAGEVLEDLHLARRYVRAGLAVTSLGGGDAVAFRMYRDGPRQLVDGWSRTMAAGAAATGSPAAVGVALWVTACTAVALGTGRGLARWARRRSGPPALALASWVVVAVQLRRLLAEVGSFRWWTWALFPAPLAAFLALFARSAVLTFVCRQVRWRGRTIRLEARQDG